MLTLETYARVATKPDWTDADRYRAIVCNLPRELHRLDTQTRRRVLEKAPSLTGTPWDALLAATAEHHEWTQDLETTFRVRTELDRPHPTGLAP